MARYLSDEWFAAVSEALGPALDAEDQAALTIQQQVEGGPDGPAVWHVQIIDATPTVRRGPHPSPTVTFTQSYSTAVAVARGDLSAQEAFMTGRITMGGDAGALIEAAPAMAAVGDALAAVRAATTY